MPAVTIYLSRLIGVVALIVAAAMLADRSVFIAAVGLLGQDRAALLLLGVIRVVCGAGIVLVHNVWNRGFWPLVVTLTGWLVLVRGVMVLFVPPDVMAGLIDAAHIVDFYYVYAAIPLVLGAYLSLRGFSATVPPLGVTAQIAAPQAAKPAPTRRPRKRR
jgi:asparagine N-glycosylation enzyme membrane subunit Stt3